MLPDRSWMQTRSRSTGLSPVFECGVLEFLDYAYAHPQCVDKGMIKCPCSCCRLMCYQDRETVHVHLYANGFLSNYTKWTQHGEEKGKTSSVIDKGSNLYRNLVIDASGFGNYDWDRDYEDASIQEPNPTTQRFFNLLKDADQSVWDGCTTHSTLSAMSQLLHFKSDNGLSNKGFDVLLKLVKNLLPDTEQLPKTYYNLKQRMKKLGLGYLKIHSCFNDCILYYGENKELQECPTCSHPRYKPNGKGNRKQGAFKILRYFPITQRLQRLYFSSKTAEHMRWHSDSRTDVPGEIRHPADGEAWKDFDRTHPEFALEVRNVRLGLATDGFNPHGHSTKPYSVWPVILTPYNLPPWMCMKKPYMFLTLIIPGRTSPGKDIDVYLRPLIDELQLLWDCGVETYDSSLKQNFQMKAALMWTISDFPAYGMLSGWSTHGKMSCPYCMERTKAFSLQHSKKPCFFDCHRQFLRPNHTYRKQKDKFSNCIERDIGRERISGVETANQVSVLGQIKFGKACGVQTFPGYGESHHWTKQSIFFELPYWHTLLIRHNLDVMHIEKNFFDNIFNTVLNVKGKSKDHLNARLDLQAMGIRSNLHPEVINGKTILPKACYSLTKVEIKQVCEWVAQLKLPDGYSSNISRCVNVNDCKFSGFKSHDCHVFMQRLLPIAFRDFLPKAVWESLAEVSKFFRDICSTVVRDEDMEIVAVNIVETICKLEKIFPPSFFDSMEHLPIHLPYEVRVGGPQQFRWMYPYERFMHDLKKKVRNKAHVEGSICEAYNIEELATFCSLYFESDVETKFNRPERNFDGGVVEPEGRLSIFTHSGRTIGKGWDQCLTDDELKAATLYVLSNCEEMVPFIAKHEEELRHDNPDITDQQLEESHNSSFLKWVETNVVQDEGIDVRVRKLASGPGKIVRCYNGFIVNGFKFHTVEHEGTRLTQNSGIMVKGSCYDDNERDYYGRLVQVVELEYLGDGNRVVLFKCTWFDSYNGVKVDKRLGLVDVNFKSELRSYEPFVLASQATQVFYASCVSKKSKDWYTVIKTRARNTYDMPLYAEPMDDNDAALTIEEIYQEDDTSVIELYNEDHNLDNVSLRGEGLGEEVDVDITTQSNIIEDEGEDEDEDEDEDEEEEEEEDEDDDENTDTDDDEDEDHCLSMDAMLIDD